LQAFEFGDLVDPLLRRTLHLVDAPRAALGRRNWISLGSDDGAEVNATFVTLFRAWTARRAWV